MTQRSARVFSTLDGEVVTILLYDIIAVSDYTLGGNAVVLHLSNGKAFAVEGKMPAIIEYLGWEVEFDAATKRRHKELVPRKKRRRR